MEAPLITVITPTTGKPSLFKLIESLERQEVSHVHLMIWDDKREGQYLYPSQINEELIIHDPKDLENNETEYRIPNSLIVKGSIVQGAAAGSALRAVGLMAAQTPYVTFADDDVWFDDRHLISMLSKLKNGTEWCYSKRRVWDKKNECFGVDDFESVGDSKSRKVPYEMVDNNSMMFNRRFGTSAAVLYRETKEYNDDRLMYKFLKQYAGEPNKTEIATVNQICPDKLEDFFRQNCTKEEENDEPEA